ncbi:prefoldin subunit alpha [Candidatus Aenigmatarchaeota archaeon]
MNKIEEEMQQKYIEYQVTKQQLNTLAEQHAMVNQKVEEITATINSIKDLKTLKKGDEVLTPLGSGVYIKTEVTEPKAVLIPIGMEITAKETHENAIAHIEKNLKEINEIDKKINKEITIHTERMSAQEIELQKMIENHEKHKK